MIKFIKQLIKKITVKKATVKTIEEGTVKFFNRTKGFGFITSTDSNEEIFVHKSGLIDTIRENDTVSYATEKSEKGLTAINVKLVR